VPAATFSSIVAQATAVAPNPSTPVSNVRQPAASSSAPAPASSSTVRYNVTGSFSDYQASDFSGGMCTYAFFSGLNDIQCDYYGATIFPKRTCSGSICQVDASTPKLFSGNTILHNPKLPGSIICDVKFKPGPGTGYYVRRRFQLSN
jgi:hypothetical protein